MSDLRAVLDSADGNPLPDAGVVAIPTAPGGRSIVHSMDFGAPLVDDIEVAARIAIANAMSDLFAVGADPIAADILLELARNDPSRTDRGRVLVDAMKDAVSAAGVASIGGHTTVGAEYRIGCSAIGLLDGPPFGLDGARPSDRIVLSKPLGIGLAATAVKLGVIRYEADDRWVETAQELNRSASDWLVQIGANAVTDVTGFGLIGAAANIAAASGVRLSLDASRVPVLDLAREAIDAAAVPAISDDTLVAHGTVTWSEEVSWAQRIALVSPETSGGLLACVPADALARVAPGFVEVGWVTAGDGVLVQADADEDG